MSDILAAQLPTLDRFLRWWFGELKAVAKPLTRAAAADRQDLVSVICEPGRLVFRRLSRRGTEALGAVDLPDDQTIVPLPRTVRRALDDKKPVAISVPAEQSLSRTIALPLAAEDTLSDVLSFEIGRQTPFRPGDVYYDYAVVGRDSRARSLSLRLTVVPRSMVDEQLALLAQWGVRPALIEIDGDTTVRLDQDHARARAGRGRHWWNAALAVLVLALAYPAIVIPLDRKKDVEADLARRVAAARAEAEAVSALRERIGQAVARASFLSRSKAERPAATVVLDELTRILPDDTWLTRLDLEGEELQIRGVSASASALIALIEASDRFEGTAFRSPITRADDSVSERFHISTRVGDGAPSL